MKYLIFVFICLSLFIGCSDESTTHEQQSKEPAQDSLNPFAEYGDAMVGAYQRGKRAAKTGNLYGVKQAVKAYYAAHGKYPETLDEVEGMMGEEIDFSMFDYNPSNGQVTLREY